jgi:hypothetical protein
MNSNNLPLANDQNIPQALETQYYGHRSYTNSKLIIEIAIDEYKKHNGKGITYMTLLEKGIAKSKKQAQGILKWHLKQVTLFTISDKRPQEYYPSCLRSEILKCQFQKNIQIDPIGVSRFDTSPSSSSPLGVVRSKNPLSQCIDYMSYYTLEGYILPLLSEAPLLVHNLTFKTKIISGCYSELNLPAYSRNQGKHYELIIGRTKVDYILYSSGTVVIHTTCSNYPFQIETEEDRVKLIGFFGQIRAGLINLLNDRHERIVSNISDWEVTECDLNKDIKISDLFHMTALKIRIKHLDHLLGLYVKAMGLDTVLRVEETKCPNMRVVDFIIGIFNPMDSVQKELQDLGSDIRDIRGMVKKMSSAHSKEA